MGLMSIHPEVIIYFRLR